MPEPRVILFEFAGRQRNLEIQLPFIRRILDEHPNTEFHLWNMARNKTDTAYINNIHGERITIRNDFHQHRHRLGWNKVYKHYAGPDYTDSLFIKLDDDIVFLETQRFATFVAAITTHPDHIVAAHIINNGACTPLEPRLWNEFLTLDVTLLNIHKSNQHAVNAHNYFFNHRDELLNQPIELIPTDDWLSINLIGYNHNLATEMGKTVGMVPHPQFIAGRQFPSPWGCGDEAAANMLPRIIMRGFTVAHLTFGPQQATDEQLALWYRNYTKLAAGYLSQPAKNAIEKLPELSPVSHWQQDTYTTASGELADWAIRSGWRPGEHDPTCGRVKDPAPTRT